MDNRFNDYPAWLWRCLSAERLSHVEYMSAELLREQFGLFGVELDAVGWPDDPHGVAAYKGGVQVASELRDRTDPQGVYEALHRLYGQVAKALAKAA